MGGVGVNAGVCQAHAGQHAQPVQDGSLTSSNFCLLPFLGQWHSGQTFVLPLEEVRGSLEIKRFVTKFRSC